MVNIFNEWTQLLHSPKFTPNEKVTLGIILDYANLKEKNKKWNNVTLQNLTNKTTLNPKTVRKVLSNLECNGFIKKRTNVYKNANDYVPNIEAIRNVVSEVNLTHTSEVNLTLLEEIGKNYPTEEIGKNYPISEVNLTHTSEVKNTPNTKRTNPTKPNYTNLPLNKTNTPLQQTAEKPTDGDEDSNTQNEAIHNTNERTSGNHNEKSEDLDLRDGDSNTNSDNHNSNNLTETLRNEDKQNSDNLNKAEHNTNEHGIGNPTEKSEDLELRDLGLSYCDEYHNTNGQTDTMQAEDNFNKANHNSNEHDNGNPNEGYIASLEAEMAMQVETMRTEGITQPIVDIDQTPDIPIEPNEDILQQAYEWFNGEGDYDPINLPNEEPIAPKNASEGLKDPRVDNYTQNPLDALKTAENPQKSNPTTETPITENGNTQIQSDSNYKKADSNENQDKPKAVAEELNTAHEKPQTPKNASEGLTTTALNNYTKTNGDTLRLAEIPQKSNCTVEEEIDAILDAVPNTPKTTEKKPSKKPKGGWYVHPRDKDTYKLFWVRDKQKCREIRNNPIEDEKAINKIVEASVNRYTVITAMLKLKSYITAYYTIGDAKGVSEAYWQIMLWYYDKTANFTDKQLWRMHKELKIIETNIKKCGFNKECNAEYLDLLDYGINVNPKLSEPKTETKYTDEDFDDEDFDEDDDE